MYIGGFSRRSSWRRAVSRPAWQATASRVRITVLPTSHKKQSVNIVPISFRARYDPADLPQDRAALRIAVVLIPTPDTGPGPFFGDQALKLAS